MHRKVRIHVLEDSFEADADDSVLRALQKYGIARDLPSYGFTRFCWNHSCDQCILTCDSGDGPKLTHACQTQACDGLHVLSLPQVLYWNRIHTER